jgi:hypothetical protein
MIAPIKVTNGALHNSFIARMKALFTYLMTPIFEKPFHSLRKICAFVLEITCVLHLNPLISHMVRCKVFGILSLDAQCI